MASASDELVIADGLLAPLGPSREHIEVLLLLADSLLPLRRRRAELTAVLERLAATAKSAGAENYLALLARDHLPVVQFGVSRRIANQFYRELLKKNQGDQDGKARSGSENLPAVDVRCLGLFEVTVDGRPVLDVEWESEKAKELLLLLLTARDPISRDEAVARLWPEMGGQQASSVFHSSLYRLRRALYRAAVVHGGGRYSLNARGTFRFDVQRFQDLVEGSRTGAREDAKDLREAMAVYRGPLTNELESEWIDELRGDLDRLYVGAAGRLIDHLLTNQEFSEAMSVSQGLLDRDPYDEGACRTMLQAALHSGDTRAGLHAYQRLVGLLAAELDERPDDDLARLADDLRMRLASSP
jgi:two-component SAPR family response regulator